MADEVEVGAIRAHHAAAAPREPAAVGANGGAEKPNRRAVAGRQDNLVEIVLRTITESSARHTERFDIVSHPDPSGAHLVGQGEANTTDTY